jgi:hypothetical protein
MSYTEPPSKRSKTGGDAGPSSNPYLAHLNPQQGNGSNGNGNGVAAGTGKNPLNGLVPRMVTTEQAKKILVSQLNVQSGTRADVRMVMSTLSKTWYPSQRTIRKS